MLHKFLPDIHYEAVNEIDFNELYKSGYTALLFDIDNTLVEDGAAASEYIIDFISDLKNKDFKMCLISNNHCERVKPFAEKVGLQYVSSSHKPSKACYEKAMKLIDTDVKHTCMIGDQLFTDIYGANRLGIHSIHVNPISKKEPIILKIKRLPEQLLMSYYEKKK